MPRISDEVQDSIIYLYPTAEAARSGEDVGGTGFLVGWVEGGTGPPVEHVYAVTCAHVIVDGGPIIRLNTKDGDWDVIEREEADWLQEPSGIDLAVCPVEFSPNHKFRYTGINDFLEDGKIKKFNIGPGDDVFMVGRFVNHDGKQRNTPTLRFGNIAMMPGEPLTGWQNVPQESFLVDMRSRSAFSGSPVFVYIAPTAIRMDIPKWTQMQSDTFYGPWLLGVDWGHIPLHAKVLGPNRDKNGNRLPVDEDWDVLMVSGINAVTPAWRVWEFIDGDPDLSKARDQKRKAASRQSYAVPDVASAKPEPPTKAENPQHREDLNRLLDEAVSSKKPGSET